MSVAGDQSFYDMECHFETRKDLPEDNMGLLTYRATMLLNSFSMPFHRNILANALSVGTDPVLGLLAIDEKNTKSHLRQSYGSYAYLDDGIDPGATGTLAARRNIR